MSKRILFLVNGYGLGNSTRSHAIIQHLARKYKIDVFVYGNSLKYFRQISEIDNIFQGTPLRYELKKGKIKLFSTLKNSFLGSYQNRNHIKKILKSKTYNLIVSDSNYSAVFLRDRPKMISINSANAVIKKSLKIKKKSCWAQFFIEFFDFIYNLFVPDLVVSPFFESFKNTKKFHHVPLIVRKEFQDSPLSFKKHQVLVMTSGASNIKTPLIDHKKSDYDLSVLGDIEISGRAKKKLKTFHTSQLMRQSTILVINGGLSSISEALAMRKPMVIVPIVGHMEQRVNALWIEQNNMGVISSWNDLEKSIEYIQYNYRHFKTHLLKFNRFNGALEIASLIEREIQK